MAKRRARIIRIILLVVLPLMVACAASTRYRALSFFFDGVPEPGAPPKARRGGAITRLTPSTEDSAGRAKPKKPIYAHPPWKERRCRACHDPGTMLLTETVGAGLCQTCHHGFPGPARYQHGPVAVNACIVCHEPHSAYYPKLLRSDPKDICFRCHERRHLTTGEHHAAMDERPCLECHDPHGGEERFFLRRSER